MSNFFDLEPNGFTPTSTDPIFAAATGGTELINQFRFASATSASGENLAIALGTKNSILLPQNGPPPLLESQASSSSPQISEPKDSLTGEETRASIQPRSRISISDELIDYDRAGNNRRKAYKLGTVRGYESFKESVSSSDRKDFVKFTVEENVNANISIPLLNDDVDLYLRNRRGKVIQKSRNRGTNSEEISTFLRRGDYYIEVKSANSRVSTNYYLRLEVDSDVGNNRRNAYNFKKIPTFWQPTLRFSESINNLDRKDFFKFTTDKKSYADINISGLHDNADLYLRDRRGKVIEKSLNGNSSPEEIRSLLGKGDYYIEVKSANPLVSTDYNLELKFVPEAGNSRQNAHHIGYYDFIGDDIQEFVGRGDRKDFYTFSLDPEVNNKYYSFDVNNLSSNVDLYLFEEDSTEPIASSTKRGNSDEAIDVFLNGGTYYFLVESVGGAGTSYNLDLGGDIKIVELPPGGGLIPPPPQTPPEQEPATTEPI